MQLRVVQSALSAAGVSLFGLVLGPAGVPEVQGSVGPSNPPRLLSAYFGYNNCAGVPDDNNNGSNLDESAHGCRVVTVPGTSLVVTNTNLPQAVAFMCPSVPVDQLRRLDAMPVHFSGPVDPASLATSAFTVTLSSGARQPTCVTLAPSNEANENESVLLFGDFGEPKASGQPYPVRLTVNGVRVRTSATESATLVGATVDVADYASAPTLLGARLTRFSAADEPNLGRRGTPNHCGINFPNTTHVVQLLWSGGVTRDGVNSVLPNEAGLLRTSGATGLFNLRVRGSDGTLVNYFKAPGVQILGAADLGSGSPLPGAFWVHDGDNYLDLCLALADTFDPASIAQVVVDPNNGAGLKLYDPSGDTPVAAQTVAVTR